MSGSFDRPPGPRTAPPPRMRLEIDPYREPSTIPSGRPTGGPAHGQTGPSPATSQPTRRDLQAPARSTRSDKERASAPIVPAGSVMGRSLTLVIAIMCFLACLTAGAVWMMWQSASAWMREIASEVTVQVEAREGVDVDKLVADVAALLRTQAGIAGVRPMSLADSSKLLEPWLGQTDALRSLPVPRLIAVDLNRYEPPDFDKLRGELDRRFKGVSLDDHRQWQAQIRVATQSFALGGLAILALMGAATTAIIISATRSAMISNREIVEVLHFVGANDRFISREFERHFMRLGIRAGLVGALSAMLVFFLMPTIMELLGGGPAATAELHRLIGGGQLDALGYVLLGGVVVIVAALCMLTSRYGVRRILHSRQ